MDLQREHYWQRRFRRSGLRLGAESIAEQVRRRRRITIVLTAIPAGIGAMFLLIFASFGRPDVGAAVVGLLVVPVVAVAWIDYARLNAGATAYLRERADDAPSG